MEVEGNCCRFCLTTDVENNFEPLSAEIWKKVADLNITIDEATTGVICKNCKTDIEAAQNVCNQILDAEDYFETLEAMQTKPASKTMKIVYECDACSATFDNATSLDAHITEHDNDCELELHS